MFLVSTSSVGATIVPARTVTAPYHGLASPTMIRSASGCRTTASVPAPWQFNFTSGIASESETGRAVNACPHTYGGSHPFSQSITNGGISVVLDLGAPAPGTTRLVAKLGGQFTISTVVSDGGSFVCSQGLFSTYDNSTYEQWNYRNGPGGGSYANWYTNYSVDDNGVWQNSSTGNGHPPSPFVLNNTTYRSHVLLTETYGFCEAVVTSYYDAWAWILDRTTGNYSNATASTWPVTGYVEQVIQNEKDFGFYGKSVWDGPSGIWTNASGPYSLNSSGFLTTNYTYPAPTSTFWYNSSLGIANAANTYTNRTVVNLTGDKAWFNQSFVSTHRYDLIVFLTLDQIAWTYDFGFNNNGWKNAYAAYSGDLITGGNGIRVVSVQER